MTGAALALAANQAGATLKTNTAALAWRYETVSTDTAGTFLFEVTWGDGSIQTFPPTGYLTYTVEAQLDEPAA